MEKEKLEIFAEFILKKRIPFDGKSSLGERMDVMLSADNNSFKTAKCFHNQSIYSMHGIS